MLHHERLSVLFSVFFVSLSVLILEISFTRIFSVILNYHYAFMVVSMALLGLGLGGLYVHYLYQKRNAATTEQSKWFQAIWATIYALTASLSVLIIVKLPIMPGDSLIYFLLALVPFAAAGAFFAQIFRNWAEISGTIYFADLTGAALGALLFLILINQIGVINTALFASGLGTIAALIIIFVSTPQFTKRWYLAGIASIPVVLLFFGLSQWFDLRVPVGMDLDKDLMRIMQTPGVDMEVLESRWSSFGRTDLTQDKSDDMAMSIFVDGAAGTPMYKFNGDILDEENLAIVHLKNHPGYFPLEFLNDSQKDTALSIGAGGGRDVLLLLMAGVRKITAVEVNPDTVAIVRDYAEYNGGLYTTNPAISVHIEEGRNFITRSREKFDTLILSLPVSKTASSINNYALNENTLFTTESILDYFDHLTPEGQLIVVTHHLAEIYKLIFTSLEALSDRGMTTQQTMAHIFSAGPQRMPVFVLKKTPFTSDESDALHQAVHTAGFDNETMFIPKVEQAFYRVLDNIQGMENIAMMNRVLVGLADGSLKIKQILRNSAVDLFPPTDDRPFFYKMERGLPMPLQLLLLLSIGLVGFIIYQPLSELKKKTGKVEVPHEDRFNMVPLEFIWLFALLGIGYMMIELSLLQRFTIFLGRPTMTLSILLFSLLMGSGLGSYSLRFLDRFSHRKIIILSAFTVAVIVVSYVFILPIIFQKTLLSFTLPQRLLTATGLILLPGFFMGFPFPTAIQLLKENNQENFVPWMWAINGAMSVVGGVLTVVIAIVFGYIWVVILGAAAYLTTGLLFFVYSR